MLFFYTFVHRFHKQEIKCFRFCSLFALRQIRDDRSLLPRFLFWLSEERLRNSSCSVSPTLPLCPVSTWAEAKKTSTAKLAAGSVHCSGTFWVLWAFYLVSKKGKTKAHILFFLRPGRCLCVSTVWHQTFSQSIGCFLVFLHVGVQANVPCPSCCLIFSTPSPHTAFTMASALMTHLCSLNAVGPPSHVYWLNCVLLSSGAFQQQDVHLSGVKIFFFFFSPFVGWHFSQWKSPTIRAKEPALYGNFEHLAFTESSHAIYENLKRLKYLRSVVGIRWGDTRQISNVRSPLRDGGGRRAVLFRMCTCFCGGCLPSLPLPQRRWHPTCPAPTWPGWCGGCSGGGASRPGKRTHPKSATPSPALQERVREGGEEGEGGIAERERWTEGRWEKRGGEKKKREREREIEREEMKSGKAVQEVGGGHGGEMKKKKGGGGEKILS